MSRFFLSGLLFLIALFAFHACNQSSDPNSRETTILSDNRISDAEFLLIADQDPLQIEQVDAFIVDGVGPLYFWVLDLTQDQKDSIKAIVRSYRSEFANLCLQWQEGTSWEEIRQARIELHQTIAAEIYTLLTAAQKVLVNQINQQLAAGEYPDIVAQKRVDYLTETLTLTAEQQQQVFELFKQYGSQVIQARNSSNSPIEFHLAKFEIFQELDQEIRALLTPDQLLIYDQLKFEHYRVRFGHRYHQHMDQD